jgi:hypothetical protein
MAQKISVVVVVRAAARLELLSLEMVVQVVQVSLS